MLRQRRRAGRKLTHDAAVGAKILKQAPVGCRIVDVHAAGEYRHRRRSGGDGAAQRQRIDARRAAGDDDRAVAPELVAKPLGLQQAVGRGAARADHGDDGLGAKIGQNALIIQHERRVVNVFEPLGIDGVLQRYDMDALPVALLQDLAGRGKLLIGERGTAVRPDIGRIFRV